MHPTKKKFGKKHKNYPKPGRARTVWSLARRRSAQPWPSCPAFGVRPPAGKPPPPSPRNGKGKRNKKAPLGEDNPGPVPRWGPQTGTDHLEGADHCQAKERRELEGTTRFGSSEVLPVEKLLSSPKDVGRESRRAKVKERGEGRQKSVGDH